MTTKIPCVGEIVRAAGGHIRRDDIKTFATPTDGKRRGYVFDDVPKLEPGDSVAYFEADADFKSDDKSRLLGTFFG